MHSVVNRRGMASMGAGLAMSAMAAAQGAAFINSSLLQVPTIPREMRAAWVATVYQIDWPTTRGNTSANVASQRTQMNSILDAMADAKMTTVFLQVRAQSDAIYPSTLEPWAYYLTGRQGLAPAVAYDPLQEWITGAKQRGLQLYAWFNPYRVFVNTPSFTPPPGIGWNDTQTTSSSSYVAPSSPYRSLSGSVREYNGDYFLDPGDPAARTHSKNVIMDVVRRYDIDGVVFDDYFYPYPSGSLAFPDSNTYALYGGGLSLANWRRKNVNDFIFDIYDSIRLEPGKGHVLFGVGPFGIWKPGNPAGVTGLSSFDEIYCDSKLWFNNGWVDFMSPQLYWRISATGQPYIPLLAWWASQNTQNRHLWPSNYTSQTLNLTWPVQEILDQVSATRNTAGATGNVHYSIKGIRDNTNSLRASLKASLYSAQALPPASPWKDAVPPMRPTVSLTMSSGNHVISWTPVGTEPARWWAVSTLVGSVWTHKVLPATTTSVTIPRSSAGGTLRAYAVGAVDRVGNISPLANRVLDATVFGQTFRAD